MSTEATGLERARACAALPLSPTSETTIDHHPLAPDHYQFDDGTRFGEWTVVGASRMVRFWTDSGNAYRKARTPCRCSCNDEVVHLVKSYDLVAPGKPSRSCGCKLSGFHHDIKDSTWLKRREGSQ